MLAYSVMPRNKGEEEFLSSLFNRLQIKYKQIEEPDEEYNEWIGIAKESLSNGFSYDEFEYSASMIKEPNPEYRK